MKKKIIFISIGIIFSLFIIFFTTDFIRVKNNEKPIFAVEVAKYKDGGSSKHVGLFYNVYCIKQIQVDLDANNEESIYIVYKEVTPWFVSIEKVKEKNNENNK